MLGGVGVREKCLKCTQGNCSILLSLHSKKSLTCCIGVMKRIKQCCGAHIAQGCQQHQATLLHAIQPQQYCSMLLTALNSLGTTTNHSILLYVRLIIFDRIQEQHTYAYTYFRQTNKPFGSVDGKS